MIDRLQKKYGSNQCQKCGQKFEPEVRQTNYGKRKSTAKYCSNCHGSRKDNMGDKTKAELLLHRRNNKSFRTAILDHMKDTYRKSGKPYECYLCGYSPFTKIVHIKDVNYFPDTALISEINSINNIICLCLHHAKHIRHNTLGEISLQKIKDYQSKS